MEIQYSNSCRVRQRSDHAGLHDIRPSTSGSLYAQDTRPNYDMGVNSQHCSFVLLAEFDIDRGAQLTYQFPQPLGADEGYVVIIDNATP
jgi:hypothetical protein